MFSGDKVDHDQDHGQVQDLDQGKVLNLTLVQVTLTLTL